jgi:hypothetical protein
VRFSLSFDFARFMSMSQSDRPKLFFSLSLRSACVGVPIQPARFVFYGFFLCVVCCYPI